MYPLKFKREEKLQVTWPKFSRRQSASKIKG